MLPIPEILKNAANKIGLDRIRYDESKIPVSMSKVCILPFFGDLRSTMIFSSLLLRRFREEQKGSKYFILVSWNGFGGLFPYVDEYWSINPDLFKNLYSSAEGFNNSSAVSIERNLNYFFEDVVKTDFFVNFYDNGITEAFFNAFKHIKISMPPLPSSVVLGGDFNREISKTQKFTIFIHPTTSVYGWDQGQIESKKVSMLFWMELVNLLLENNFLPIIQQSQLSYNLNYEFGDKCLYIKDLDQLNVLAAMRASGCVLDVFNNISRFAILARCPFVACEERNRYSHLKDFELDDLMISEIPRDYIFSFSSIVSNGAKNIWKSSLFDLIAVKLKSLALTVNRDKLPSSGEMNKIVPYSLVREKRTKKFNGKFIKIPR